MKKHLTKTKVLGVLGAGFIIWLLVYLISDAFYGGQNFRTMQDKIYSFQDINLAGLREIKASGGNLPRLPYVSWKLSHIPDKKIILDLKSEFHGYVHGVPTTFLAYNRAEPGLRHIPRRLVLTGSIDIRRDLVTPESEEVKKYGYDYKAIDIGSKFIAPDQQIDAIVDFFDHLPQDTWVHVHCTNGAGRTTTALAMLDMLKNAPTVSINDIVKRQHLLGGVDLFDTVVWKGGTYTKAELENRKKFIEKFYEFACQRKAGGIQHWSQWNAAQPDKVTLMPLADPQ